MSRSRRSNGWSSKIATDPAAMVQRVHRFPRLVDRPGRGEPHHRMRDAASFRRAGPHNRIVSSSVLCRKARAECHFASDCANCDWTTLFSRNGLRGAARILLAGSSRNASITPRGNSQPDAGEPRRVKLSAAETIQRSVFPPVDRLRHAAWSVRRDEQILYDVFVTGGATQSQRVPDIDHRWRWTSETACVRTSFLPVDLHMRAEPSGVLAAAGEAPGAGDAV